MPYFDRGQKCRLTDGPRYFEVYRRQIKLVRKESLKLDPVPQA